MRLTHIDVPDRVSPRLPVVVTQVLFAIACSGAAVLVRYIANFWLPDAGPFALAVPAVLVATLFGRWLSGVITQVISSLYAWYFVLPVLGSFRFLVPADELRLIANMLAGFFVVVLAEIFRRAVRNALADRDALLLELQHRIKNNFASVASVLRLQISNAESEETQTALQSALGRVESFAQAYAFLYHDADHSGTVNMQTYVDGLCSALAASLTADRRIRLDCDAAPVPLPRDRAIAIGLIINEVATNSAKHAFPSDGGGTITVRFAGGKGGYEMTVGDDGKGMSETPRPGSLGLKLIDGLVKQAHGHMEVDTGAEGTTFRFDFAR